MFYEKFAWLGIGLIPAAITYLLSFIALFIGSITDFRTREVPDWLNYGLLSSGLGLNLLFSVVYSDSSFVINSIIGLAVFFGIAYIMFYAGQWGGGDSKMLMGLGAMIGIDFSKEAFLFGFFINALFIGAIYGLLWGIFLILRNRKKFLTEFKKTLSSNNIVKTKNIILIALVLLFVLFFLIQPYYLRIFILLIAFLILATFYLWVFSKSVEKSCMHRLVEPSKLTEGDWIVKDVYAGGKYITGPKDLGIEKKQIRKLVELYRKGKVGKILIKEGIPFVPSFLLAFIVTLVFGNPLIMLL